MDSKTSTSSSSPGAEPLDLEAGLETTPEDVAALRRARRQARAALSLRDIRALQLPSWAADRLPDRGTSEGWEPFEL